MKPYLSVLCAVALMSCGGGTTTPTPTPAAPLEVAKTAVGTLIGSPVTQVIGSSGGSAEVISAGAKIVVPAGALPDGSSLSVQAISNTLSGSGQGIRISGDAWTQPITVQFSYPIGETDPGNSVIAVQQAGGKWLTSKRIKVDAATRTISVRLAPGGIVGTQVPNATGLRPQAKLNPRDIVWTKGFTLTPNSASLKLGESVSFVAFASVALSNGVAAKSLQATASDDDDLVPLPTLPDPTTVNPVDDEELNPIAEYWVTKSYPFTNTKAGFNRTWTVTTGPGSVVASGAIGAVYTAPSDASAKGKTATVTFISINTKTDAVARASASVNIEGDGATYKGTVTVKQFHDITTGPVNGQTIRKYSATITGNMILEIESNNATRPIFKGNPAKSSTICDDYATSEDIYFGAERHGKSELVSADGSNGISDPGLVRVYMDKSKNTYELSGELSTNITIKDTYYDGSVQTYPFLLRIGFGVFDLPLGDGVQLTGSKSYVLTEDTYTVTWNFTRQ
jgi:hypothetical protein